jgi:hypothetical protein
VSGIVAKLGNLATYGKCKKGEVIPNSMFPVSSAEIL